ncbi:uncharacterized protein BDCG_05036 [Blastomyces dermatitidis ER-3]|uniref:Duf1680 domain-containing protein n=1 Tax=Ajellomyces dermatitidis (strain ER-3 / ATCC MYA-2586) TaxID=559297 RepID=A0ABP2EZX4_AJEDR|nr:uncharacterized protein BDCG_05036 [Blastomyces dermatitidis ER-3]EEQ89916.1 hypothetical protein BDCG_05036 [Blastomyces dermatitidis ER-3]
MDSDGNNNMGNQNETCGLLPFVFEPLPLGAIKPLGWLSDQLTLMANGLAGHEFEFYQIVRDNPWLGGTREYSNLNEAMPYWFNGLVPLAYQTQDKRLLEQVRKAADYILTNQQPDGWLGPETTVPRRNFWARYPIFLGFAQMVEAQAGTPEAERILNAMHKFVQLMHSMLSNNLQGLVWHEGDDFNEQWGRSRAADMILALQWLYETDPRENAGKLFECMEFFRKGGHDWSWWFSEENYIKVDLDTMPRKETDRLYHFVHGVNAGQGLKAGAVIRRFTHDDALLESARRGVNWTFLYHGGPSGGIIADERLVGLSPVRGTELCSVVESMYSLSYLYQSIGDRDFADRCELAAFNALPVMVTPDWWAHQYIAQINQPVSHEVNPTPWFNVGSRAQTFGLQPNYPCCTVNHHQGYPKFVSGMFVRNGEVGIAHALLGPAEVQTRTRSGTKANIRCETNYPFENVLYYRVDAGGQFTFSFRVPLWANNVESSVSIDGAPGSLLQPNPATGMHHVDLTPGKHVVIVSFATAVRVEPRANDTVAIYHGALLYSLPIDAQITSVKTNYPGAPNNAQEYTMKPTSKWGLAIDPSTVRFNGLAPASDAPNNVSRLPNPLWAEKETPTSISAMVCEIKWELTEPKERGYAPEPPLVGQRECIGRPFEINLVPYGGARLHMAELPTVKLV